MPTMRSQATLLQTQQWLLSLVLICVLSSTSNADWPHWRGVTRDGHTTENSHWQGNAAKWLAEEPLWSASVGEGGSSPIVANKHLYAFGWADDKDSIVCFDAQTGEQQWKQDYSAPKFGRKSVGDQALYSGPNSTPEFDPASSLLFTLGNDGDLYCWNTAQNGTEMWHINLYDRYESQQRPKVGRSRLSDYGFTSSPLVYKDVVIVEVGGVAGTLVAFDKQTGEQRWVSQAKHIAGHTAGPALMTVAGVDCVAVLTFSHLLVTRIDEGHAGETVAEYEWTTAFANNVAGVCVAGERAIITSAYDHNAICCLEISLQGATRLWEQNYPSKVCTPVVAGEYIYLAWHKLQCLDLATGELVWEGESFGDAGSIIVTADERLIAWVGDGELILAETAKRSPDQLTVLAKSPRQFRDDAWPHLAMADGRLYCKSRQGEIHCFVLGAP